MRRYASRHVQVFSSRDEFLVCLSHAKNPIHIDNEIDMPVITVLAKVTSHYFHKSVS